MKWNVYDSDITEEKIRLSNFETSFIGCLDRILMSKDFMREFYFQTSDEVKKQFDRYLELRTDLMKSEKDKFFVFVTAFDSNFMTLNIITFIKYITQNEYFKENIKIYEQYIQEGNKTL